MTLLAKFGFLTLLAGATATAVYADPADGWISPNGTGAPPSAPLTAGGTGTTTVTGTATGSVGPTGTSGTLGGTAGASATVGVTLSLAELQGRVRLLHAQTRSDSRHVQHLQLIARKEKDVIKLNCVNDKLVQLKPQMNIADAAEAELEQAHDSDRATLFESVAQAADNIRRLREEADQCIGEPIGTAGESSNSFTGPPSRDDPTRGFEGPPDLEAPAYASPYN